MKKLIIICAALLLASPALGANYTDWTQPYDPEPGKTVGLWHFDVNSGDTIVPDETTNNNDAVIDTGATAYGYGPLDPDVSYSAGKFDTGTNTWWGSGTDLNIGVWTVEQDIPGEGNSSLFVDGDFTLEFWMNPIQEGSASWQKYILCKADGSVYNVRWVGQNIELGWYGTGAWTSVADTTTIPLNEWHHVQIRVDNDIPGESSHIEFWIDGVLSTAHDDDEFEDDASKGYDLHINGPGGSKHPYNCFRGHLDEVRISNYYVPEPTTISLLAIAALAFLRRKK
jgi:hypothetical protein